MKKTDPLVNSDFSLSEFVLKCQENMRSHALFCDKEIILDGDIHRYSADEYPEEDEWYIGDMDVLSDGKPVFTCTYGSWSTGEKHTYSSVYSKDIIPSELKKYKDSREIKRIARELKKKSDYNKVAKKLSLEYRGSKIAGAQMNMLPWHTEDRRYFTTKNIRQYECDRWPLKFHTYNDSGKGYRSLVIPIINIDNKLRSVEYIYYKDDVCIKSFHKGGEKKGNFYPIDGIHNFYPFRGHGFSYRQGHVPLFNSERYPNDIKQLYIVEGYATGASIFEALSNIERTLEYCVIVAFDAGNIPAVVGNLRTRFYNQEIIICADDDEAGNKYADNACQMYNCKKISIKRLMNE
jgi:putative DNA primase/helicase